jgi:tRNA A-37 threonylcarbamoyl transferase component Bud32
MKEVPTIELSTKEQINILLEKLPRELAVRWEKELSGNEQNAENIVKALQEVIAERESSAKEFFSAREEKIFENNLESGLREVTRELIEHIADEAIENKLNKIGEGLTAKVVTSKIDSNFCFKVITDQKEYKNGNDVKKEMEFLDKVCSLSEEYGVKVPKPYYYQMSPKAHVCVMERLDAIDFRDVIDGKEALPENFNLMAFFSSLQTFIAKMHEEKNVFHRDLHGGNLMIQRKTGMPGIVDFGTATNRDADEEKTYREGSPTDAKITKFVKDESWITEHRQKLVNLLQPKK